MMLRNDLCMLCVILEEHGSHKIWLHVVHFRTVWFGAVQFSASYTNLRQLHILQI